MIEPERHESEPAIVAPGERPDEPGPFAILEWSFNPWRERPHAAALALLFGASFVALLAILGLPALGCVALGLAASASFAPLLIPSRCRIDEAGIAHRRGFGWERRRWDEVRRVARVRGGLLLSPFERPQRLDAFRALVLPIPRRLRAALEIDLAPTFARHGLGAPRA